LQLGKRFTNQYAVHLHLVLVSAPDQHESLGMRLVCWLLVWAVHPFLRWLRYLSHSHGNLRPGHHLHGHPLLHEPWSAQTWRLQRQVGHLV